MKIIDGHKLIENLRKYRHEVVSVDGLETLIDQMPSAEPECNLDEWCHDCKEYDKEKNRCPRFNRVIRTALSEWRGEKDALN